MAHPTLRTLLLVAAVFSLLGACMPTQAEPNPQQITGYISTSVALTLTSFPAVVSLTNTPLPTPTESLPPTATFTLLPTISPTATPNPQPAYACDIINQRPWDDTTFHRNDHFDIKWTIVNTGTNRWEDGTYLEYITGPEMTEVTKIELPLLKPGKEYDVVLDAIAPHDLDRQVMVWGVYGPGPGKHPTFYWMCYPYVRIIVEK